MKKVLIYVTFSLLILGLCGCEKSSKKENEITEKIEITENIKETKPLTTTKQSTTTPTTTITKKTTTVSKKKTTTTTRTTTKTTTSTTPTSNNIKDTVENVTPPKEEITQPKEENNKKIVVCTIKENGSYYNGIVTHTTTFEKEKIIHNKLYIEKHFFDGYKAEEDDWTISNISAIQNNTKVGISGKAYIENNTTYVTINYDVSANSSLIEYITSHTEYNDFINHMTTNNGYTCITK